MKGDKEQSPSVSPVSTTMPTGASPRDPSPATQTWPASPHAPAPDTPEPRAKTPAAQPAPGATSYDLSLFPIVDESRYEILEEVGKGGLGRVVKAFDRRLRRVVAIKEMLHRTGSTTRFVHEALATAGLEHPGIIPIYEAGRFPNGDPFYAMKLVSGRSLADVIAERPTLASRLGLLSNVIAIADTMAYAHSKHLVHRDLKPANVLVGAFGETVVIDWGVAKNLASDALSSSALGDSGDSGASAMMTAAGTVLGTPAYMPPEQASGKEVDERADVYAIGAILYEVLAGRAPHDASTPDVIKRILAGKPLPLEERQAGIAPDLLTIVSRAMAPDPADRYRTAQELADELRRFQTGQLVTSHTYSPWALVKRWLRRQRLIVGLSLAVLVVLAAIGVVSIRRVVLARNAAEAARREAEQERGVAESRTNALLLAQARALLEVDPTAALSVLRTYPAEGSDWAGVGALVADAASRGVSRRVLRGGGELLSVAFARDGSFLAGAGSDERVRVWDLQTGQERTLTGTLGKTLLLLTSSDGRYLLAAGPIDKRIWVWDTHTGAARALVGHDDGIRWMGISNTGTLVSSSRDKTLRSWNLDTGESRVVLRFHELGECGRAAISKDGRFLAWGGVAHTHAMDLTSGREVTLADHDVGTGALTFSEDGAMLASGGMDGGVRLWDLGTGRARVLSGHKEWVTTLAFSPDGTRLLSAAGDGMAWLWKLPTGEGRVVPAAFGETRTATFSPDSRHFAIAGDDRMLRVFSTDTLTMRVLRGHGAPISALAFSPDSASLASASLDKTVRLWSVTAGGLREIAVPEGGSWGFKLSEGDREVALPRTIHGRPALYIADVKTGLTRELLSPTATRAVSLQSSSGQPLSDSDVGLRRYLLDGGACEHGTPSTDLLACAYSRDGNLLASGGLDTIVRVYDQTANATRVLGQHEGSVVRIAFSADEHFLASGSSDKTVRVWDLSNGASRVLRGHEGDVEDVAFTSDGSRLGSVSMDGTLRVWDLRTEEARVFGGDQLAARALAFTHDDRFALTGDRSGSVRLWDLATGEARVVRRHAAFVRALAVTKDDRTVLSIGGDGAVWLWDLDTRRPFSRDPNELRAWMGELSAAE